MAVTAVVVVGRLTDSPLPVYIDVVRFRELLQAVDSSSSSSLTHPSHSHTPPTASRVALVVVIKEMPLYQQVSVVEPVAVCADGIGTLCWGISQ
jgi:hypothetical protein